MLPGRGGWNTIFFMFQKTITGGEVIPLWRPMMKCSVTSCLVANPLLGGPFVKIGTDRLLPMGWRPTLLEYELTCFFFELREQQILQHFHIGLPSYSCTFEEKFHRFSWTASKCFMNAVNIFFNRSQPSRTFPFARRTPFLCKLFTPPSHTPHIRRLNLIRNASWTTDVDSLLPQASRYHNVS